MDPLLYRTLKKIQLLSIFLPFLLGAMFYAYSEQSLSQSLDNGFNLSNASIPKEQIMHGGPPRDGIPALTNPAFIQASKANFLASDARVLGVYLDGESKAYPISILNYHEIVNDQIAGKKIAVTFCPLCGTGIVYDAKVGDRTLNFGVSGLLYNSDVLLYDRQSESLWSQIISTAISGPMKGQKLMRIPALHTTWQEWLKRFPGTLVLSQNTGYQRNYQSTPYEGYNESNDIFFPVTNRDFRYHSKEVVIALEFNGLTKAYPFVELAQYQKAQHVSSLRDTIGDEEVVVEFNLAARSGRIIDTKGEELPSFQAFWFAWMAFHPNSEVFSYQK